MDKPFEAVIWGWLLVDDEVPRPTPGEVLSGLQLCIGPLGPRYQDLMESLSVRATVEWAMFDEWNHRINTVIAVDGNRFVYIAPDRSDHPMPTTGSSLELTGFMSSLPCYDFEDLEIPEDLVLTEDWRVTSVRRVPDDDSLIVELEPVRDFARPS